MTLASSCSLLAWVISLRSISGFCRRAYDRLIWNSIRRSKTQIRWAIAKWTEQGFSWIARLNRRCYQHHMSAVSISSYLKYDLMNDSRKHCRYIMVSIFKINSSIAFLGTIHRLNILPLQVLKLKCHRRDTARQFCMDPIRFEDLCLLSISRTSNCIQRYVHLWWSATQSFVDVDWL